MKIPGVATDRKTVDLVLTKAQLRRVDTVYCRDKSSPRQDAVFHVDNCREIAALITLITTA